MLEMLVDLVTTRLERDPVPCGLLATLALVSNILLRTPEPPPPPHPKLSRNGASKIQLCNITFYICSGI